MKRITESATRFRLKSPNSNWKHNWSSFLFAALFLMAGLFPLAIQAGTISHNISAAALNVVQNDTGSTTNSVTVTSTISINDMRVRAGSVRGTYDIQVGPSFTDDIANGLISTCVSENGRDSGTGLLYNMTSFSTNFATGGYMICPADTTANRAKDNGNVAVAYFPYNSWICGWARNNKATNGGVNNLFTSSPGVNLGTQFKTTGAGTSLLDLRTLGYNSTTDGILLVNHGKDEGNFSLSQANSDGTWNIYVKDNHGDGNAYEQDPTSFVFIPRTNNSVVSGKFMADGTAAIFSGPTQRFAIAVVDIGTYRLTSPGLTPSNSVLITSPEGGLNLNQDNIINYQPDGDGWLIFSRDINTSDVPVLETPTDEPVADFVIIPGPTPGFTLSRTNGINTTEDGGTGSFTVTLDFPPTADVTINVSSSDTTEGVVSPSALTFTTNNWNLPQTVTVTGVDDNIVDGPIAYTIILAPAISADTNYNGLDPADISAVNADNDQPGITVSPTNGLVTTEDGGSATFSVRLDSQPSANVSINFTSSNTNEGTVTPPVVTFTPANYNVFQIVTVTGVDDFVVDGDVGYTISTAPAFSADLHYDGLKAANISVTNKDNDTPGVLVSINSGISVVEGGITNYALMLNSSPIADVVINLTTSNPLKGALSPTTYTFNSNNWNIPQIVTLMGVDNSISDGNFSYTINGTATSTDPLYAGIAVPVVSATTLDNEPIVEFPVSAANVTVIENDSGSSTNSVSVSTSLSINDLRIRPGSSRGKFEIQVGVFASDDTTNGLIMSSITENGRDNAEGSGQLFAMSAIEGVFGGSDPGYEVVTYDTTANRAKYNANFAVAYFTYDSWLAGWGRNSTALNGGPTDLFTGSPGLALGNQFNTLGGGQFTLDLRMLGINSTNDGVLIVNHAKDEGNFALSKANADGTWSLYVKDNHGDAASYEQDPIAFVFIPRTNTSVISGKFMDDASIAIFSGASPQFAVSNVDVGTYRLTIPGYSPSNGVLIVSCEGGLALNEDNIVNYQADGDGWIIESRDINATPFPSLETPTGEPVASFVFIPGPKPGFTVTPTNGVNTSEDGGTGTFTVTLNFPPTADVTIAVASSDPTEGIASPSSLTFTTNNWNIPQTVTVTGVDDNIVDGPIAYTIVLSPAVSDDPAYNGLDPADVAAVNADNDQPGVFVTPTSGLVTTEAGGSASFKVRLNAPPVADVTIGLSSSNPGEGVPSPSSLTFNSTNYNILQTVTVTGVNDFTADGTVAYQIITAPAVSADPAYSGVKGPDVSLVNLDDDAKGISLSLSAGIAIGEGQTTNYTIVLASSPVADVLVHLTSSNPLKGIVSPATLTFNSNNWNIPQVVTVMAPDNFVNDGNVNYTITSTVTSADPLYSGIFLRDVVATTIDNEPALTLPSGDSVYGVGTPFIFVDHRGTIVDQINSSYAGGSLTASVIVNGSSSDNFQIQNSGNGQGQIGISSANVSYGGDQIGTFTGGANGQPLVISLNGESSPEATQALLQALTFSTSVDAPQGPRTVQVALNNGVHGISSASKQVRVSNLREIQFQEGADYGYGTYTGENDISLSQVNHFVAQPAGTASDGLLIDWPDGGVANESQVLMRFDNIIGTNPNQIPPGATIVYAQLYLTIINPGDGGIFYRMLIPWDATNATWDSVGGGIFANDIEARSVYESELGLQDGSGATGTGTISMGVTPDIQAWVNGQTNYGWFISGWPFNTDGTGFFPSEATVVDARPRLRVVWAPAGEASVAFRENVNGYTNAFDTRLRQITPNVNAGGLASIFVDAGVTTSTDQDQVLMRFDQLFGTGSNQVPTGARIDAAILDLASVIGNGMGNGGQFFAMLEPWSDQTDTWNSLGNGIQADGVKAAATPTTVAGEADLQVLVQGGFNSFDVTSDVQAWSSGVRTNYGWAILPWPGGTDGWGFATAEDPTETERPQLRVFYTVVATNVTAALIQPLAISPGQVQIQFNGTPGKAYSIQRAAMLGGMWNTIGSATVGGAGAGSFMDTNVLSGSAFYRVMYP